MNTFMTLLVFSLVIAAVLTIIGTPLFIGICLLIARMKGTRNGTGNGRGRRPTAAPARGTARSSAPDRGWARGSAPSFPDGRRLDGPRPRAASRRGDW